MGHQGLRHNLDYHSCEGEKCKNKPISQVGEKIKLILSSSKVVVLCTMLYIYEAPFLVLGSNDIFLLLTQAPPRDGARPVLSAQQHVV